MTRAEYALFKEWARDDLVDGTLPFDMNVWTGADYEERVCSLPDGLYQAEPLGADFYDLSLTLDVEDY